MSLRPRLINDVVTHVRSHLHSSVNKQLHGQFPLNMAGWGWMWRLSIDIWRTCSVQLSWGFKNKSRQIIYDDPKLQACRWENEWFLLVFSHVHNIQLLLQWLKIFSSDLLRFYQQAFICITKKHYVYKESIQGPWMWSIK